MADAIETFLRKAALVGPIIDEKQDYKLVRPILRELLDIVQQNPGEREDFEAVFIKIFEDKKTFSGLVVEYCMHVLRFQNIRDHAEKRLRNDRYKTDDRAKRVLEAYSPNWVMKTIFDI